MQIGIVIAIVVVMILIYVEYKKYTAQEWVLVESLIICRDECRDCVPPAQTTVLNPYMWPYSGISCIDNIYKADVSKKINLGTNAPRSSLDVEAGVQNRYEGFVDYRGVAPVSRSVPDHVELVN